jgi:hypothetical protein
MLYAENKSAYQPNLNTSLESLRLRLAKTPWFKVLNVARNFPDMTDILCGFVQAATGRNNPGAVPTLQILDFPLNVVPPQITYYPLAQYGLNWEIWPTIKFREELVKAFYQPDQAGSHRLISTAFVPDQFLAERQYFQVSCWDTAIPNIYLLQQYCLTLTDLACTEALIKMSPFILRRYQQEAAGKKINIMINPFSLGQLPSDKQPQSVRLIN